MFETKQGIIKPIIYVGMVQDSRLLLVDYKEAPNPAKKGWWIPAPGLEFGEDPTEKAERTVEELGFLPNDLKLQGVESFVLPGGWHLIYHFKMNVEGKPKSHPNVNQYKWVSTEELQEIKDIAHGKWEIGVGKSFLG